MEWNEMTVADMPVEMRSNRVSRWRGAVSLMSERDLAAQREKLRQAPDERIVNNDCALLVRRVDGRCFINLSQAAVHLGYAKPGNLARGDEEFPHKMCASALVVLCETTII
jgi:hypothetical protein